MEFTRDAQEMHKEMHKEKDYYSTNQWIISNISTDILLILFLFLVFFINDYSFHAVFDPIPNASNIRF